MSEPTLARRYAFKLLANLASMPVYLVMEAILPRALGPQTYGNYAFVTNLFQQFVGFLDMGTSACFYNALSRRQHEWLLVAFYMRIAAMILVVMLLASALLLIPQVGEWIMPAIPLWMAPLGAVWAFLFWWSRVLRAMNDAIGATVQSELVRTACSLGSVMALAGLFWGGWLHVSSLFLQQYILMGSAALGFWLVMRNFWSHRPKHVPPDATKAYSKEFFTYSHPLFVKALLSFLMLSAERWLLQWFEGSAQQGFFALSQKVSMACFLFVSAMTPLIMRELAIAWGHQNREAMGRLLTRFAPMLYMIAAYFSCFTMAESDVLVRLFGGEQFLAAIVPVQIMALYPVHQIYGQLAGSVFHASGRTTVIRNITALECVYGFATAWFVLAPPAYYGLGLGATGLAIKTVCVQFVTVNIYVWLASRMIPLHFWRNLFHQFWCVLALLALAYACRSLAFVPNLEGLAEGKELSPLVLSGIFYTALVSVLAWFVPSIAGLSRQELQGIIARIQGVIHKKH